MRYTTRTEKRRWPKRIFILLIAAIILVIGATVMVRHTYFEKLKPVSINATETKPFIIAKGSSVDKIAQDLQKAGLIRSAWAFKLYVSSKEVRNGLQAGTYSLSANQSVPQIVAQLTHGLVTTNLVTILPAQRIDQIRATLISYGFSEKQVDAALNPENHLANPALVDKPDGASLEGYIYPDSYEKTSTTNPQEIIEQALSEMNKKVTPAMRDDFAAQGLSTYQALIVASMVEKEVSTQSDRNQVAQVFIKRLHDGILLGSDVTAFYGAIVAGQKPSTTYDSPYNTRLHKGLPPGPISNVSASSLLAVAHPAKTDWLFFVAGDDGKTYFAKTAEQHQANVDQYCHKLCAMN